MKKFFTHLCSVVLILTTIISVSLFVISMADVIQGTFPAWAYPRLVAVGAVAFVSTYLIFAVQETRKWILSFFASL